MEVKILYHISNQYFDNFSIDKLSDSGDFGRGIYMTDVIENWLFLAKERNYEEILLYTCEVVYSNMYTFENKVEFMNLYPKKDFIDDFLNNTDLYYDGIQYFSKNTNIKIVNHEKINLQK